MNNKSHINTVSGDEKRSPPSQMINENLLKNLTERSRWYSEVFNTLYHGGEVIKLCASNEQERVKAKEVSELFNSLIRKYGSEVSTLASFATNPYIAKNEVLVSELKDDVEKCGAEAVKKFDEQKEKFLAGLRDRKGMLTRALRSKGLLDAEFDE